MMLEKNGEDQLNRLYKKKIVKKERNVLRTIKGRKVI
jgi:hypothetical protein